MWVTIHNLNPAIPRQQIQKDPLLRRPMVPRLRQDIPKTVVTVYDEDAHGPNNGFNIPFYRKLFKFNSVSPGEEHESIWTKLNKIFRRGDVFILTLMFLDILVNTTMLILNYTTLVVDFLDNIDWSTAVIKVESVSADGNSEHEHYTNYLHNRISIMEKLNLLIYILIYVAQFIGFYGVLRDVESMIVVYVTQIVIQIIVLIFTVILRPFWLPVCILRILLFVLGVKQCLRLSNRNVQLAWDFDVDNTQTNLEQIKEDEVEHCELDSSGNRLQVINPFRRRSQTMPSSHSKRSSFSSQKRTSHSMSNNRERRFMRASSMRGRMASKRKGSIDESSVIEVMASINHVLNIPVPAASFDADSIESAEIN